MEANKVGQPYTTLTGVSHVKRAVIDLNESDKKTEKSLLLI